MDTQLNGFTVTKRFVILTNEMKTINFHISYSYQFTTVHERCCSKHLMNVTNHTLFQVSYNEVLF